MFKNFFLRLTVLFSLVILGTITAAADNISDLPSKTIDGRKYYYYEVQPKETVFSITHKFSISPEKLMEFNPAVRDGLKAYSTLYFPADAFGEEAKTEVVDDGNFKVVTIQKGQSLFGLSREYDVTVDDILAANPGLDVSNYKAGEQIRIPVSAGNAPEASQPVIEEEETEEQISVPEVVTEPVEPQETNIEATEENVVITTEETVPEEEGVPAEEKETAEGDTLNITLMLPLDASAQNPSRTARLYIEFYRGFLVGVKERSSNGTPLKINVIDTSVSDEEYNKILNGEVVATTDLFIGPENESRLVALAKKAAETEAYIISPFIIKDELSQKYPSIIQMNIPREKMYEGAISKFLDLYKDYTPVFISRVEGDADKSSFTEQLKASLKDSKVPYKEIVFRGALIDEDLRNADVGKNMVVVPSSGNRNEYLKYIESIVAYKDSLQNEGKDITLFGYPEWITMRGESEKKLKNVGAVIYSRYAGIGDNNSEAVRSAYRRWYGEDWQDVEPNQALMGYDIAGFAIDNLRKGDGDMFPFASESFDGVQNTYLLGQPFEDSGYVNEALYFIHFAPGGLVNEIVRVPSVQELGK